MIKLLRAIPPIQAMDSAKICQLTLDLAYLGPEMSKLLSCKEEFKELYIAKSIELLEEGVPKLSKDDIAS